MRSDTVKKGIQQAPHRSLFNALGLTEEELQKPLIGVVSSYNEIVPGHMNLDKITEAVKMGVAMAGGVPIMVPAERPDIRLILKSGNFGQEDFFGRALAMTAKPNN